MPVVLAHQNQVTLVWIFQMAEILLIFFYVPLLPIWLSLRVFILGTVMHLYGGYPDRRNIMQLAPIFLKLWIFKNSYFAPVEFAYTVCFEVHITIN